MSSVRYIKASLQNESDVYFFPNENKQLKESLTQKTIKRTKEVLKESAFGAVVGASFVGTIGWAVYEVLAIEKSKYAICHFPYEEMTRNKRCEMFSCERGKAKFVCTVPNDKTFSFDTIYAIPNRDERLAAQQSGMAAHHEWWSEVGYKLWSSSMVVGALAGAIGGGVYGFFKKIKTAEEIELEKKREQLDIENPPMNLDRFYVEYPWENNTP
jgi:hypothetical protein